MSLSLTEKLCHAQHSLLLIIDIQERLTSAMPAEIINNIIISNVESVIFEWLRDASHPKFKTLSKLIK